MKKCKKKRVTFNNSYRKYAGNMPELCRFMTKYGKNSQQEARIAVGSEVKNLHHFHHDGAHLPSNNEYQEKTKSLLERFLKKNRFFHLSQGGGYF